MWVVLLVDAAGWQKYVELSTAPADTLALPVSEDRPLWTQEWRLASGTALFIRCPVRDATGVPVYAWLAPSGRRVENFITQF